MSVFASGRIRDLLEIAAAAVAVVAVVAAVAAVATASVYQARVQV